LKRQDHVAAGILSRDPYVKLLSMFWDEPNIHRSKQPISALKREIFSRLPEVNAKKLHNAICKGATFYEPYLQALEAIGVAEEASIEKFISCELFAFEFRADKSTLWFVVAAKFAALAIFSSLGAGWHRVFSTVFWVAGLRAARACSTRRNDVSMHLLFQLSPSILPI